MSKLDDRNIEKVPDRCGGRAVVAGTRIRVATVLACYRQGMTVEEILQEYPHLRPADVHDALAYAYEHAERRSRPTWRPMMRKPSSTCTPPAIGRRHERSA